MFSLCPGYLLQQSVLHLKSVTCHMSRELDPGTLNTGSSLDQGPGNHTKMMRRKPHLSHVDINICLLRPVDS